MTSKTIYLPYFYIIRHKSTGKMYAGAKWAKGCHPDELMQVDGYTTSSPTINQIIEQEGLDSFEVLTIDTNLDGLSAYEYESLFLQTINCADSDDWYNGHNNSGMAFGLPRFYEKSRETLMYRYGVIHPSQIHDFRDKVKSTCASLYGNENYNNIEQNKETCFERYGDWAINVSRNKFCNDNGVDNVSQLPGISKKVADTKEERYGTSTYNNREQCRSTCLERYGVENYNNPQMSKQTKLEKYGDSNYTNREQAKNTMLSNIGYDNVSKVPFLSIIETRKTYAKNIISRRFPELKKYY
jgi:hypothetical protein